MNKNESEGLLGVQFTRRTLLKGSLLVAAGTLTLEGCGNPIELLDEDPMSATVSNSNLLKVDAKQAQELLQTKYMPEHRVLVPYFIDSSEPISYVKSHLDNSPYVVDIDNNPAANMVEFTGLKKGGVIRSPFDSMFGWSTPPNSDVLALYFQQEVPTDHYRILNMGLRKGSLLVNYPPVQRAFSGSDLNSVSLGQPIFSIEDEALMPGKPFQMAMAGNLFMLRRDIPPSPIGPVGNYYNLDIHFMWTKQNKILAVK